MIKRHIQDGFSTTDIILLHNTEGWKSEIRESQGCGSHKGTRGEFSLASSSFCWAQAPP